MSTANKPTGGFARRKALEDAGFAIDKIRDGDHEVWAVHDPEMDMPGSIVAQSTRQGEAIDHAIRVLGDL